MPDPNFGALRLKSYFSGTVEAALDLARKELGDEALLVNARPATPETRHLGKYEVVFGLPAEARLAPPALPPPLPVTFSNASDPVAMLTEQIKDLRRQMASLLLPLNETAAPPPAPQPARGEEGATTEATLGLDGARQSVVMFVGPPGVGKTTALIKIAARYGVHVNRGTQILTTDVLRVAAAEQVQTLAAILGAGCEVVDPAAQLGQAIAGHPHADLVLIDTPGLALSEIGTGLELARAAVARGGIDTHLVLSASMKAEDVARMADAYAIFRPNKILITRLDETLSCRSVVDEAVRLRLPVSFLSAGQRIPDDIEPATRRKIADLLRASGPQSRGASA